MASTARGDGPVQEEIEILNQEYRYMEGDRKTFGDYSQNVIRKQRQTIERWKKENDHLRAELGAIEARQEAEESDAAMSTRLDELNQRCAFYSNKLDSEQALLHSTQKQVKLVERKIREQRRAMGGVNAAASNTQTVAKQIRVLENRLDKALVKFNEALSHNKSLRTEIDNLRRERVVFDSIYRGLEKKLVSKKQRMAQIIEASNSAYDARDTAQDRMNKMKESHLKAMAALDADMTDMNRMLKAERRAKNFILIKEQERMGTTRGGDRAKSKKKSSTWAMAKTKSNIDVNAELIQTYEEAFDKIQAATMISDIDELVSTFVEVEDQNFSLFNFVNDLTNDIEKLEEQIHMLREQIESAREHGESLDKERRQNLKHLAQRLARTESRGEQYEAKAKSLKKITNQLRTQVHSTFNKIGCQATDPVLAGGTVTQSNLMAFLSAIEARTLEILHLVTAQQLDHDSDEEEQHHRKRGGLAAIMASQRVPPGGDDVVISPPSTYVEADDDLDNDFSHPLSREELIARSKKGMSKKDQDARSNRHRRRRQNQSNASAGAMQAAAGVSGSSRRRH